MRTLTLSDFLLARIAEDEAVAENTGGRHDGICWSAWGGEDSPETMWYRSRWDTARVLAECEARRRIVAKHQGWHRCDWGDLSDPEYPSCDDLRLLALPYADHPDYREEEWKP